MVETTRDRPTASRRRNVILSQKVAKRPRRTRKTKDQGSGVNEHDMNDVGAALAKTVEVENDGGNQFNVSDMGDDFGDEPIDMGDEPTDMGDDPGDEPTDMGDYEDQPADRTEKVNEDLTGPFPGGPYDPSILKSFHCHIAAKFWHNDERGILKCLNHGFKVGEWSFNLEDNEQSKFHGLIKDSGLISLVSCSYKFVNKVVVSAFVERWQPETNTFHLPFGEMSPTLDDVSVILGIPVIGKSVSCKKLSNVDAANLLVEAFGVTIDEANVALKVARGQSIKVEWLRQRFGSVSDVDNDNTIECTARAYLLYLLGCTLFADKTGTRVPVVYLSFLMDLRSVASYAWGAAALAFLYRQLGTATRYAVKQMAGYMTLLEAWIYEHFVGARPHPNLDYKVDQPRVFRWISRTQSGSSTSILQRLREDLDRLEAHDVIWDPYHDNRIEHPFFDVAYYNGCLKCMHIVEPYHPDRVLRQFGRVQIIPSPPLAPVRASRGSTAKQYIIAYKYLDTIWESWENHLLSEIGRSVLVLHPWDCVPGYLDWFTSISHVQVQNPTHRSKYNPRTETSADYRELQFCLKHFTFNARNWIQ